MASPKLFNWLSIGNRSAASKDPVDEDGTTVEHTSSKETQHKASAQPDSASDNKKSENSAPPKNYNPTQYGSGERSGPGSADSATGDGSFLRNQNDQKFGSISFYKTQQGEYPDEDKEFIANTRTQTPKEDVVRLKWDLILERDQRRKGEKELADYKAIQEKIWQEIHDKNKKQLQNNVRGKPKLPNLGSKTHQPLYDNLVDRLRECTVRVLLDRARNHYDFGDYQQSEEHAEQARVKHAAKLEYEPLSAWCQFHIGKAQYGQKRYNEALLSFEKAEKASGMYIRGEVIDEWVSKAKAGDRRTARSGTSSAETAPWGRSLADQLVGRGDSGSSKASG